MRASRKHVALAVTGVVLLGLIATSIALRRNANPLPADVRADSIRIEKSARRLTLLRGASVLKEYSVALGKAPIGQKEKEGDNRTPEGIYAIDRRLARSRFHRALHISYPTPEQQAAAAKRGVSAGGDIMIHGLRNGMGWMGSLHRCRDWTAGCIAVTDAEIEEIWRAAPDGTRVEIVP
jgi:murein L,D-transpeptidase YafK